MRLFGFEIIRCETSDLKEADVFKNLVMSMCREVTEFRDDLNLFVDTFNDLNDIDPDLDKIEKFSIDTIKMINIHFNCIKNYISLYCDNKFSDQFVQVSLVGSMQKLADSCGRLQALISTHSGTLIRMSGFMETEEFTSTNKDAQIDFIDKHDEFMNQSRVLIKNVIELINITILRKMYNVILYDIIEIDIGVDLIRSRLHRKKMKNVKVNGKRVPDYQILIFNNLKGAEDND